MRLLIAALTAVCLAVPASGQRDEVSAHVVANLNPTSYIFINNKVRPAGVVISGNRSAMGLGAGYEHWVIDHVGVGVSFDASPSAGKLLGGQAYYRWPLAEYIILAYFTERMKLGKWDLLVREGGGSVVTQSLVKNSMTSRLWWASGLATLSART
jgi:hypothetical protein